MTERQIIIKAIFEGKIVHKDNISTDYKLTGDIDLKQQLSYFPKYQNFHYSDFVYVDFFQDNKPRLMYFDCWGKDIDNDRNEIVLTLDLYGNVIHKSIEEI